VARLAFMYDTVIILINIFNCYFLLIRPAYFINHVAGLLRNNANKIIFLEDVGDVTWVPGRINHIICQLWIDECHFYEWKMTENGEILKHTARELKRAGRFKHRERMNFYGPKPPNRKNGDSLLRYKLLGTYSTRGLMGWVIRRYVTEAFVMAKMAGFKQYNFKDYIDFN